MTKISLLPFSDAYLRAKAIDTGNSSVLRRTPSWSHPLVRRLLIGPKNCLPIIGVYGDRKTDQLPPHWTLHTLRTFVAFAKSWKTEIPTVGLLSLTIATGAFFAVWKGVEQIPQVARLLAEVHNTTLATGLKVSIPALTAAVCVSTGIIANATLMLLHWRTAKRRLQEEPHPPSCPRIAATAVVPIPGDLTREDIRFDDQEAAKTYQRKFGGTIAQDGDSFIVQGANIPQPKQSPILSSPKAPREVPVDIPSVSQESEIVPGNPEEVPADDIDKEPAPLTRRATVVDDVNEQGEWGYIVEGFPDKESAEAYAELHGRRVFEDLFTGEWSVISELEIPPEDLAPSDDDDDWIV